MLEHTCPVCHEKLNPMCWHRIGKYYIHYNRTNTYVWDLDIQNLLLRLFGQLAVLTIERIEKLLLLQ